MPPNRKHPLSRLMLDSAGRLRASWRFLLFALLYVFFTIGISWAGAHALDGIAGVWLGSYTTSLTASALSGAIAVLLATLLMLGAIERRGLPFVGLGFAKGWLLELALGFVAGGGMIGAVAGLELATGHLVFERAAMQHHPVPWVFFLLALFVVVAIHEEMLFRGYAFQRMIDAIGAPASVLLLAVGFGAIHLGNPGVTWIAALNTALVGILFALVYLRTGRLWAPIGLHWGWNLLEAFLGLPVSGFRMESVPLAGQATGSEVFSGGAYGPEASAFATFVIAAGILVLFFWKPASLRRESKEVV